MKGVIAHLLLVCKLNYFTHVHNAYPVAHVLDYVQIMRDEKVGEAAFSLELAK